MEISWEDLTVIFDDESYDFICKVTGWSVLRTNNTQCVVATKGKYYGKRISRLLLNAPKELEVDHINGNTLDNRKENLRLCTSAQNKMNTVVHRDKTLRLPKGVVWRKDKNKYNAKICINYTNYHLGYFNTVEEAEAAYKRKAEEWQGEFAAHISRKDKTR